MINNQQQYIADQFYNYYNKKEKFGLFLGLLKRNGESWGFQMMSEMQDYRRREKKVMPIQFVMLSTKRNEYE